MYNSGIREKTTECMASMRIMKTPEGRDGKPLWNLQTFWLVLGKEARQGS